MQRAEQGEYIPPWLSEKDSQHVQRFEFITNRSCIGKGQAGHGYGRLAGQRRPAYQHEVTLTFDSTSDQMNERKKSVSLIVKSGI